MKRTGLICTLVGILVGMTGIFSLSVRAAGYPQKPIKLIVGFAAGSGNDIEARALAPFLQKHLGVRVIVENQPGAEGKTALTKLWKTKPDGYTITIHPATMSVINQYLLLPEYKILEFSHIFSWTAANQVLVVHADTYKTFEEFVKEAKKRILAGGTPGLGTTSHLSGMMLADGVGIKVNWVPFSGSGEAVTSLAGKHIEFAVTATPSALPLVRAGKLRPLLVLANKKDVVFPDVPLARDIGYNFPVIPLVRGADAPPNTPLPIILALEAAFAKAIKEPEYIAWAEKRMSQLHSLGHVEYGDILQKQQRDVEKYKDLIKQEAAK
jgi:tripartite-type tricarboxylate transporter receptor subunit TctC